MLARTRFGEAWEAADRGGFWKEIVGGRSDD